MMILIKNKIILQNNINKKILFEKKHHNLIIKNYKLKKEINTLKRN